MKYLYRLALSLSSFWALFSLYVAYKLFIESEGNFLHIFLASTLVSCFVVWVFGVLKEFKS